MYANEINMPIFIFKPNNNIPIIKDKNIEIPPEFGVMPLCTV